MKNIRLKCPACGFDVLSGETTCDACQRVFTDDDVQQMLDERRRLKYSPQEVIKSTWPFVAVILFIVLGLGYFGYRVNKTVENYQALRQDQLEAFVDSRLSLNEEIESYSVSGNNINIKMKHYVWKDIDENEKRDSLKEMQMEFTDARNRLTPGQPGFVSIEVTDLAGNPMAGINSKGELMVEE